MQAGQRAGGQMRSQASGRSESGVGRSRRGVLNALPKTARGTGKEDLFQLTQTVLSAECEHQMSREM